MSADHSSRHSQLRFALLYLGEGAPIGFIWWALPTWLRLQGVPIAEITSLTGMLVLPWVGKFLWAPLVDRVRDTRRGLRGIIVAAQLLMGLTLLPLAWLGISDNLSIVRLLLLGHALAAATQDVAVDALALRIVPPADRGRLNGAMQAGMLIGRSVFGGGALVLSAYAGWPVVIGALIGCIWLSTFAVLRFSVIELGRVVPRTDTAPSRGLAAVLRRPTTWMGLIFAACAGAGYEVVGVLCGPMMVDRGVSQDSVGWFLGVPVVIATIGGGLLGGVMADRQGLRRSVTLGLISFCALALLLAGLSLNSNGSVLLVFVVLTALYFTIGLFTAASYAMFMGLSQPPLAATQFSAFMAATNGCEAWASWVGGQVAGNLGYGSAFALMSVISIASLPLIKHLTATSEAGGTTNRA